MIINGRSRRCVWWWSKHLQDTKENEQVRLVKSEGLASEDIYDLLCEIEGHGLGTKCKNPLWIAVLNPGPKEHLTDQDWERAREILEQERGYQGQPYFVIEHEKNGWKHRHVIYSRIDTERMRALPDGLDAKVCHAASRKIEIELGLERVPGPFDREPGTPRPPRAPEPWEMYRGMQTNIDPRDIAAEVTELFRQSQNGMEFQAALLSHGYELATGRRGLLILDTAGKEHSLARRIEGVKTAELNAFMRDVDRHALPTIEQAKEKFQERKIEGLEADRATVRDEIEWEETLARALIEKEKIERRFVAPEDREKETRGGREQGKRRSREEERWPINSPQPEKKSWTVFEKAATEATRDERTENLKGEAAKVWQAWRQSDNAKAFAAALDEKGITFARVTDEEAYRSQREADFAKAVGNRAARFKEGEIVIVTERRPDYRRNGELIEPVRIHKLDQSLADKFIKALGSRDKLQGIEATLKTSDNRAQQRAADRQASRLENATRFKGSRGERDSGNGTVPPGDRLERSGFRMVGKVLDVTARALESLIAPTLTPEQIRDGQKAVNLREAEAEQRIDFSSYTAEMAHQRQREEQEREAERQRERDRDGGGRER